MTTADWHEFVGVKQQARRQARRKLRLSVDAAVIAALPTARTFDPADYLAHCIASARVHGGPAARLYATRQHAQNELRRHGLEDRTRQRVTQRLAWGFSLVVSRRGGPRPRRPPFSQIPGVSIIACGDAYWGLSRGPIKGTHPPIARTLDWIDANCAALDDPRDRAARPRPHHHIRLPQLEYLTSQVCNACWKRALKPYTYPGNANPTHHVLRCTQCGRMFDRDVAAAINMGALVLHGLFPEHAPAPELTIFTPPS